MNDTQITGLIARLRRIASGEWTPKGDEGYIAQAADAITALQSERDEARAAIGAHNWERRAREAETELAKAREILAGSDYGSLPNDWTLPQIAEARMDDINKLTWQVRDTCRRAEAAEACKEQK